MYIACFYWELLFIFMGFFLQLYIQNMIKIISFLFAKLFQALYLGQNCKTVLKTEITSTVYNVSLYKDLVFVHKPMEK